jgi:hypothetical protein
VCGEFKIGYAAETLEYYHGACRPEFWIPLVCTSGKAPRVNHVGFEMNYLQKKHRVFRMQQDFGHEGSEDLGAVP